MPLFVFRAGIAVAVPADYVCDHRHRLLVDRLNSLARYADVVTLLEQHPDSWLAADVLTGAPWARKFLNTTARLSLVDPKQARRGTRALMRVLNGVKPRTGRRRVPALSADVRDRTADVLSDWRAHIDALWPDQVSVATVVRAASGRFPVSKAHRHALTVLLRRKGLRKRDLVRTLVSWETGVPVRRLRTSPTEPERELIYG